MALHTCNMIRTFSEWQKEPIRGIETLPSESLTVPDMSLSVKDILTRFRRGTLDIESLERRYHDGTDDIDDDSLDGLDDIVDVWTRKQYLDGEIREILHSCTGTLGGDSPGTPDASSEDSGEAGVINT